MGGNVFKGKTRRYSAEEYHKLVPEILDKLSPLVSRASDIKSYSKKESFGDMDILYIPNVHFNIDTLTDVLSVEYDDVIRNGNVWSVCYNDFQIDLIKTTGEEFEYAKSYFDGSDVGNLRGKIAHKFGLKHGHSGLIYVVRSENHVLGEIVLTRDPKVALDFLNIEDKQNFETLEEIFENVIASKYFNPEIYAFENMNAVARIRDKKRDTYNKFLKYLEGKEFPNAYHFEKDKTVYIDMIFTAFPHARAEFDALWEKKRIVDDAASKFNGTIVSRITGLENKELGNFMKGIKEYLKPDFVTKLSAETVENIIKEYYNGGLCSLFSSWV